MKKIIYVLIALISVSAITYFYYRNNNVTQDELGSAEEAEIIGFGFVQDFIKSAPPESDEIATRRAYEALSIKAKKRIGEDNISGDIAGMFGVQDVPDMGVSAENLIVEGNKSILTVGLNYSGSGRILKEIILVEEGGSWKVDDVN